MVSNRIPKEGHRKQQKHRANVACRKHQFEKGGAVLHQDGNDVAAADAARGEPARRSADARVERCIGDLFAAIFQRTAARGPLRMKRDEARQVDHLSLEKPVFRLRFLPDEL